jgi:hypothetical protein
LDIVLWLGYFALKNFMLVTDLYLFFVVKGTIYLLLPSLVIDFDDYLANFTDSAYLDFSNEFLADTT